MHRYLRSAPITITADGISRVETTLSLSQAHAPWPAETYVELRMSGLHGEKLSRSAESKL